MCSASLSLDSSINSVTSDKLFPLPPLQSFSAHQLLQLKKAIVQRQVQIITSSGDR